MVSPSSRQSGEFLRKAAGFSAQAGNEGERGWGSNEDLIGAAEPVADWPGAAGERGEGARGFSAVSLLLVDEAARVSDELYLAVRPMLAVSDGALWLMSTPFGKRGFFYEAWANGGPEWVRIRAAAPECPRIGRKFLEEERATMGDRWFRQEYLCEFEEAVSGVFGRELVERAISEDVAPLEIDS